MNEKKLDYKKPMIEIVIFNNNEIMTASGELDFEELE